MLLIDRPAREIPAREFFDNRTQTFVTVPAQRLPAIHLQLEHSLLSIAKWEGKWHTSFLENESMTAEEFLDYVRCMTVNAQKDPSVYDGLTQEDFEKIVEYMRDPMSATELPDKKQQKKKGRKKPDTAESFYFAMTQLGIPFDCEKWHFNRLAALINYCAENDAGGGGKGSGANKPKSQREMMELYHALNQKNRKKYNSKG